MALFRISVGKERLRRQERLINRHTMNVNDGVSARADCLLDVRIVRREEGRVQAAAEGGHHVLPSKGEAEDIDTFFGWRV